MRTPIKFYTVSGVVGEHRHTEYDIGATTKSRQDIFSLRQYPKEEGEMDSVYLIGLYQKPAVNN